jgi:hypothetical protein
MPIIDLYSSRLKQAANSDDVWTFDSIPKVLRVQVSNIVKGALGTARAMEEYRPTPLYDAIDRVVSHEHGIHSLSGGNSGEENVHGCLLRESDLLIWLDCVEATFRIIENRRGRWNDHQRKMASITTTAKDAIHELNERFRRAGFGYRFEHGAILRIDNEFTHAEITRPALALLGDARFSGANDEFRSAHDHFKAGEYRDCAVDALNAVESTMKTICELRDWQFEKGARSSDLQKILRREGLFPEFADQSFDQLIATLKSGLPALRNETGGHGQGAQPKKVPLYVASYALNLAASTICFLVGAFNELDAT